MADQKLTELDEETDPQGTDLVYVVTDPGGTPTERKVQISNLPGGAGGGSLIEKTDGGVVSRVSTAAFSVPPIAVTRMVALLPGDSESTAAQVRATAGSGQRAVVLRFPSGVAFEARKPDDDPLQLGFFGVTPSGRPQIDGSTATVADLCAALHALGLIEDTSL